VVNPFVVPGTEDNPDRPLCPWRPTTDNHRNYYVPVDNTERAFEYFTERLSHPARLRDYGRLVVVLGLDGCGKTALVNRCVDQVLAGLGVESVRGLVIDLRGERLEAASTKVRMGRVWSAMLEQVGSAGALRRQVDSEFTDGYRRLVQALADDVVLLVLLPPTADVPDELVEYARLAAGRILFFAECAWGARMPGVLPLLRAEAAEPPIELHVSMLGPDDFWHYAEVRQAAFLETAHRDRLVYVTKETMNMVSRDVVQAGTPWSIRRLHRTLVNVSEHVRTKSGQPGELTYDDFKDYIWQESLREGRN
jgi:hypothetical protein